MERRGLPTPCNKCLPYLLDEHSGAIEIFMMAIDRIRYSSMGKPIGVDLNTVIELVKLTEDKQPVDTIKKVMLLSHELIKDGN